MYLVRINVRGDIEDRDSGVYLIPEFKRLFDSPKYGVAGFKLVALYHDYESPFRFQEDGPSRLGAIGKAIYGDPKVSIWKDQAIIEAGIAYNYLQDDPIRNHLNALIKQLRAFDLLLEKESKTMAEIEEKLKVMKQMTILRQEINKVKDEVASSVQTIKIKGDKVMSWLEEREFTIQIQNNAQKS